MLDRNDAVETAAAILLEARSQRTGAADKLIIVMYRFKITADEIGSNKAEIEKLARNAIIERTVALMTAAEIFQNDFDILARAADLTASQRSVAERLKRSGPTKTLIEEAAAFQIT
jgi:thymidine kinase